ncbi:hypothetical protein CKO15_09375 [Halorhodospira abdelmalekii]|uniref:type I-MYXAN CRISPR-associated protein Cas6/Cmx6 n=1 Tax=Halorhodospira abdelmalekii TaxID=421629 RepID=UPI0019056AEA|nr:type I-MYXAN CRISPR-associated protein Cas6/Cmx6 [Halorhodospira abdelmalekii]MBK1735489.1 hypothetical protein [Halorhodospira abdelmalekii]
MFWNDDEPAAALDSEAPVVDLYFRLHGDALPPDYPVPLAEALAPLLLERLGSAPPSAAIGARITHLPEAGHGWWRDPEAPLLLSRRSQLVLRTPRASGAALCSLVGCELVLGDCTLLLGAVREQPLVATEPLYAARVLDPIATDAERDAERKVDEEIEEEGAAAASEAAFLRTVHAALQALDIQPRRLLSGRRQWLATPSGVVATRSLLVDGIGAPASVALQAHGLGGGRLWGCGFFVPHKSVVAVHS